MSLFKIKHSEKVERIMKSKEALTGMANLRVPVGVVNQLSTSQIKSKSSSLLWDTRYLYGAMIQFYKFFYQQ
jgi:hypothetical protein